MNKTTLAFEPSPVVSSSSPQSKGVTPSMLWILRMLVRGGVAERFQRRRDPLDNDIQKALSIPELAGHEAVDASVRELLVRQLEEAEKAGCSDETSLARNVATLGRLFQ